MVHINSNHKIAASLTTISGQLYEAVCTATMVGSSLAETKDKASGNYTFEEISIAKGLRRECRP